MNDFNLKVNDRIQVVAGEKAYKTLIIDIEDDFLRINVPVNNGEYLMVHLNEKIEMNSYFDNGSCFKFYSNILSRGREGNIVYYEISKPFDITKIQRRNFFRVDLLDKINYKKITDLNKEDINNLPYKEAVMVDLSGGGLKCKVNDDIKTGDLLLINMIIKGIEIEINCDVVRDENTLDKGKICGLRFLDITSSQIDVIIQALFEIVRKQRAMS